MIRQLPRLVDRYEREGYAHLRQCPVAFAQRLRINLT
jgi:hypothetical protein